MKVAVVLLGLLALQCVAAKVFFEDRFDSDFAGRWVQSSYKGKDQGALKHAAGEFSDNKGLQCSEDMRWYTTSAEMTEEFNNEGKPLVFQFTAKLPKKFDCGGAYIKVLPAGLNQKNFDGDSDYNIMFGPDICGYSTSKVHTIFNYKGKNLEKTDEVKLGYSDKDEFTHLYTLIVNPDNTYDIQFDGVSKASGKLEDGWKFLPPKEIDDPTDKKPSDWVDEPKMVDPEDKKPEGYDDIPKQIRDPDAKQPEEWDEESDGEWEAPMIDNPEYKGEWKPKMIDNPDYKGEWKAKQIANPEYFTDDKLYHFKSSKFVGIEVWQVNGGTVFDNILVTDDVEYAKKMADEVWKGVVDAEKKLKEAEDAKKKAEEEANKKDDDEDDDDDDEDDKKEEL